MIKIYFGEWRVVAYRRFAGVVGIFKFVLIVPQAIPNTLRPIVVSDVGAQVDLKALTWTHFKPEL